jgi:hypothetical protein
MHDEHMEQSKIGPFLCSPAHLYGRGAGTFTQCLAQLTRLGGAAAFTNDSGGSTAAISAD